MECPNPCTNRLCSRLQTPTGQTPTNEKLYIFMQNLLENSLQISLNNSYEILEGISYEIFFAYSKILRKCKIASKIKRFPPKAQFKKQVI